MSHHPPRRVPTAAIAAAIVALLLLAGVVAAAGPLRGELSRWAVSLTADTFELDSSTTDDDLDDLRESDDDKHGAHDDGADDVDDEAGADAVDGDVGAGTTEPLTFLVYAEGSGGMDHRDAARLRVPDVDARGDDLLTDAIMLVRVHPDEERALLASIPRDLWLPHRGTRINAVRAQHGPNALVADVEDLVGVDVDHVVGVNFLAFATAVDALGGVELPFDQPLRDRYSHLEILDTGCVHLDAADALAYARSRRPETAPTADGPWQPADQRGDFGRVERQQQLAAALWEQHRGPGMLPAIPRILATTRDHVLVDDHLRVGDLVALADTLSGTRGESLERLTLPAAYTTRGGASVLDATDDTARAAEHVASWPDDSDGDPDDAPGGAASESGPDEDPLVDADDGDTTPSPVNAPASCD